MANPSPVMTEKFAAMQFKPAKDRALARKAIATKLPEDLDALVRSLPNHSQFVREAIIEKLQREGLVERDLPS
ncbi:hypothetical protein NG791_26380 [Laspinema sp. D1]|uniref:hypothetical protein n=1 Tax=Laspinema palackyanum TaxID=3231601 RepID=UPI003498FC47|nr:hypothetical protein [Laspinema sp. D2b]